MDTHSMESWPPKVAPLTRQIENWQYHG